MLQNPRNYKKQSGPNNMGHPVSTEAIVVSSSARSAEIKQQRDHTFRCLFPFFSIITQLNWGWEFRGPPLINNNSGATNSCPPTAAGMPLSTVTQSTKVKEQRLGPSACLGLCMYVWLTRCADLFAFALPIWIFVGNSNCSLEMIYMFTQLQI